MDHKLNDSGFNSPGKLPAEVHKVQSFLMKLNLSNDSSLQLVELSAKKDETLAYAIKQRCSIMNVKDYLFWAKIKNFDEKQSINPYTLPCGLIQVDTEVEWEKFTGKIYDHPIKLDADTKPYSKLFFISMSNRRNKIGITYVHYEKLGRNNMCVVALSGETFKDALSRDGRFKNVSCFCLKRKVPGGEAIVDIDGIAEEMVLHVTGKPTPTSNKTKQSSTSCLSESASASFETEVLGQEEAKTQMPKMKHEKISYDRLGEALFGKGVIYDFPKDVGKIPIREILDEMSKCLKALTWYTLFGPTERAEENFENSLEALAEVQFANHYVVGRPASFTKKLSLLLDSIGYLECGDVYGTCFLVSTDLIVTCRHVVKMIETARGASSSTDHSRVFVYFDYEDNRSAKPLSNGYELLPLDHPRNVWSEALDYAFLFLKPQSPEKRLKVHPLGKYVTRKVPMRGNVSIAGHPFGYIKQDELCPILPAHDDGRYRELQRRVRQEEEVCKADSSSCVLSSRMPNTKCVHMYRRNIEELCGEKKALTYDVGSFFEGSSGSPVFDMNCEIVALHTGGFRLRNTSILEYGVTFDAIIEDLKECNRDDFVTNHIFCCEAEPMQVD